MEVDGWILIHTKYKQMQLILRDVDGDRCLFELNFYNTASRILWRPPPKSYPQED